MKLKNLAFIVFTFTLISVPAVFAQDWLLDNFYNFGIIMGFLIFLGIIFVALAKKAEVTPYFAYVALVAIGIAIFLRMLADQGVVVPEQAYQWITAILVVTIILLLFQMFAVWIVRSIFKSPLKTHIDHMRYSPDRRERRTAKHELKELYDLAKAKRHWLYLASHPAISKMLLKNPNHREAVHGLMNVVKAMDSDEELKARVEEAEEALAHIGPYLPERDQIKLKNAIRFLRHKAIYDTQKDLHMMEDDLRKLKEMEAEMDAASKRKFWRGKEGRKKKKELAIMQDVVGVSIRDLEEIIKDKKMDIRDLERWKWVLRRQANAEGRHLHEVASERAHDTKELAHLRKWSSKIAEEEARTFAREAHEVSTHE